jgi:MFS family permease
VTIDPGLRGLLRQPLWRRWTLASFLARLPNTMTLLALVLVGEELTGSIAVGAQLSGVAIAASGLAAPWRGRRLDRFELRAGLQRACTLTAVVMAAQVVALAVGAALPVFFVLAALQGVAFAAVSGGFRALLVPVVPPTDLPRANAMEAVFVEVAFVAGPALAGILALLVGPLGVLVAMSASVGTAAVIARKLPALDPPAQRHAGAPWRAPGAWPVYALAFAIGASLGIFESALPARAVELGMQTASAGYLLTLVALGSGIGGLASTMASDPLGRARVRGLLLLLAFGVLLVPVALLESVLLLAVALLLCGVPIAPLNALGALLLQHAIPPGRQAEGFAVYIAAILLGAGIGQSITGQLLDGVGSQALLLGAALLPAVTALTLIGPRMGRRFGGAVATSTLVPADGAQ